MGSCWAVVASLTFLENGSTNHISRRRLRVSSAANVASRTNLAARGCASGILGCIVASTASCLGVLINWAVVIVATDHL